MVFTITPNSGPRGTLVTLKVAGCLGPAPRRGALGFQIDDQPAEAIPATTTGTSLSATFRMDGTTGKLSAHCLDTVVTRTFTVTG
jgi:hypothetical protein